MGDLIVIAVLLLIIGLIIFRMVKNRKAGKKCSCGCGECAFKDSCHSQNEK
ncbi:MAG: FeoB-associated Cys-rich membrane protein [Clostridia bacterium]|nr:FeoB-associated Cys-rich membrane protein [Clostridia bacterium]